MRIAVASVNGRNVADHLNETTCFLVFQVDGNCIGAHIRRPAGSAERLGGEEEARRSPTTVESSARVPNDQDTIEPEVAMIASFLPAFADCDFLLAGGVSESEASACARFGIVALPVPGFRQARDVVAFVVTGQMRGGGDRGNGGIPSPRPTAFYRA